MRIGSATATTSFARSGAAADCVNAAPNTLGESGQTCPPWDTQFATQPSEIRNQSTYLYPYYGPALVVDWG